MTTTPKFQRRDFEWIADVIADFGYPAEQARLAEHFTRALRSTNPAFDSDRFMRRCQSDAVSPAKRRT